MNGKTFVDTNVLLYAYDPSDTAKYSVAKQALRQLWDGGNGVVSMQVLNEFYTNATRKRKAQIGTADARAAVEDIANWCVDTTPADIVQAWRIEDEARISFWDAMIVAAAMRAGAERILSEDLNPGQTIGGVRIENPFAGL